jgi:hypothetical protein
MAKEAIKQAFKAKYEARLKTIKKEFESKFKKNDQLWRQRMDCHKQVMQREQAKAREYEEVIREMSDRLALMERKNREMREMLVRQGQQQQQLIMIA